MEIKMQRLEEITGNLFKAATVVSLAGDAVDGKVQQCAAKALLLVGQYVALEATQVANHSYEALNHFNRARKGENIAMELSQGAVHMLHVASYFSGSLYFALITHLAAGTLNMVQAYHARENKLEMGVKVIQGLAHLNQAYCLYECVKVVEFIKRSLAFGPKEHLVTINGHGAYNNEKFTLPNNVYVLIPHPKGLNVPYTLSAPPSQPIEELIYKLPEGQLPLPTSSGWFLAKPGDKIHNLKIYPWGPTGEKESFKVVPALWSDKTPIYFNGEPKSKVKIFQPTNLKNIVSCLKGDKPLVVIPLTCNATSGHNQNLSLSPNQQINVMGLFGK